MQEQKACFIFNWVAGDNQFPKIRIPHPEFLWNT